MDKKYWRRRSLEYEAELMKKCKADLEPQLAKLFKDSLSEIEKEIYALYGRYQSQTGLSYAAAQKLLRGKEFSEWRMTLKEYVALSHSDSKILKELNTLAMRSRISRLEKLYTDTLMQLQNLGEKYDGAVKDFLTTAYRERYYHGVYDMAKVGKLEVPVTKVQPAKLEQVLAQKWQGGNYSSRIWKNTEKLSATLKTTISQGLHRGLSVKKLSKQLSKEMGVSYKNAERLVRTELNFVQNYAAKESLEAAGLEEYEFIAVLDNRTTPRCQALDGTYHLLEEYSPGTNAPPMHPRCRSTISAIVEGGKRTAKVNGKNVKIPANVSYKEWRGEVVRQQAALQDAQNLKEIRIKAAKKGNILSGGLSALPAGDVAAIVEKVKAAPEDIRIIWNLAHEDIKILDAEYAGIAHYNSRARGIYLKTSELVDNPIEKDYQTLFHEAGHLIDQRLTNYQSFYSKSDPRFERVIRQEAEIYIQRTLKELKKGGGKATGKDAYASIYNELQTIPDKARSEVSDMFHGATKGKVHGGYGHWKKGYWNYPGMLGIESFAHLFEARLLQDEQTLQAIKKYFPGAYWFFEQMLREAVDNAL